jgi:hypothetical protein
MIEVAAYILAGLVVFAVLLVILAILSPALALALIEASERLVAAFFRLPREVAQKVKRKTD